MENISDPFMYNDILTKRLVDEYRKHKKLIVAFDFDDTIYDFHKLGRQYHQVIDLLQRCRKIGFTLTLFTDMYEGKKELALQYCASLGITPDCINDTPEGLPFGFSGKPYYNVLLDDRAGLSNAYNALLTVVLMVESEIVNKQLEREFMV